MKSYVDVRYSHHDHVPDDYRDCRSDKHHSASAALLGHRTEEAGSKDGNDCKYDDRKCSEEPRGKLRFGNQRLDVAPHGEPLTNQVGKVRENLAQVATR